MVKRKCVAKIIAKYKTYTIITVVTETNSA